MNERLSGYKESRINPSEVIRKIWSMKKYLPVVVGAAAMGRIAMSPNLAIEAGISSLCFGTVYDMVTGESEKGKMGIGITTSAAIGGALTVGMAIWHGTNASGALTIGEVLATMGIAEAYLLLKAQGNLDSKD